MERDLFTAHIVKPASVISAVRKFAFMCDVECNATFPAPEAGEGGIYLVCLFSHVKAILGT